MLRILIVTRNWLFKKWIINYFIDDKPAVTNGISKFKNPSYWLLSFHKIPLFSKDLIPFIISLISLFDGVIPETLLAVSFLLSLFIPLLAEYYLALIHLAASSAIERSFLILFSPLHTLVVLYLQLSHQELFLIVSS